MRPSASSNILVVGLVAGLGCVPLGCSSEDTSGNMNVFGPTNNTAGAGVGTSGSGTGGSGTVGTGGTPGGGTGMTAGGQATAGNGTGGASGGTGGDATGGGTGGGGGGQAGNDITSVWKSDGCGKPYTGATGNTPTTLQTSGEKAADCAAHLDGQPRCGLWGQAGSTWRTDPVPRDYYVYLPEGYDPNKAYPLVFQGPGCGGSGKDIYPLNDGTGNNVGNTVIRVGLTPPPNYVGHGTNENQGCFDDKEGDDSVDWVFYEMAYDKLNAELCFDRNRVFSAGNSSGSWFSNEVACKYAGDAQRPIRAPLPNTGGLPTEAAYVPTCTQSPMAGMWVHEVNDGTNPFAGNKVAIARAMSLNTCTMGTNFDNATTENFPIGGGNPDDVCKKIVGCNPLYPLVVCPLPGNGHGSHDNVTNPGFSTFIKLFSAGALAPQ